MRFNVVGLVFFCLMLSCATSTEIRHVVSIEQDLDSRPNIFLKQSFVEIEKKVVIKKPSTCSEEQCDPEIKMATASGVIIHKVEAGSYILSAEHVCNGKSSEELVDAKTFIKVLAPSGKGYPGRVLWSDFFNDTCVIWVPKMDDGVEAKASQRKPVYGDRVINLASPLGIAQLPHTLPLLEGHYCGSANGFDMYSIPATGGSSGGPIFDFKGYLIGMVQASLIKFPIICLSARYNQITRVIKMVKNDNLRVGVSDDKNWRQSLSDL